MARKRTGKPVGSPPKGPYSKNVEPINARVTAELKAALIAAHKASGYSLSQEIAQRLDHSFTHYHLDLAEFGSPQNLAVCRLIGMMMRNYHAFEGDGLWDNAETHDELKDAVMTILDGFGPDGGIPKPVQSETAGRRRGRSRLDQLVKNKTLPEPLKVDGKIIERSSDDYSFPEIWKGLGTLGKKLEAKQ
jgi:hypothetical protein